MCAKCGVNDVLGQILKSILQASLSGDFPNNFSYACCYLNRMKDSSKTNIDVSLKKIHALILIICYKKYVI